MSSVREMRAEDWPDVRRIYLEGIATGQATFETEAPTWEQWDQSHHRFARFILMGEEQVVSGWCAISSVSQRRVYSGVAEVSVYVTSAARGRGVGSTLLEALIHDAEKNNIWTLQASIFPENTASVELHRRFGFREIGRRKRIAKLNGVWRDTVLLERRSAVVGIE